MVFWADRGLSYKFVGKVGPAREIAVVGRAVAAEVGTVSAADVTVFADEIAGFIQKEVDCVPYVLDFAGVQANLAFLGVGLLTLLGNHIGVALRAFLC